MSSSPYRMTFMVRGLAAVCLLYGISACSVTDLVGNSQVPAGTSDPAVVASPEGAVGLYVAAQQRLADAVKEYVTKSGLLSDELRPFSFGAIGSVSAERIIDSRYLPQAHEAGGLTHPGVASATSFLYSALQRVRGAAREARGALRAYAPVAPRDFLGHLYALEGFAEVLLADLYCSGIPLSTIDFGGDYTLKPGLATNEVYRNAIVMFDSAIALAPDSARIRQFAHVGKIRALLALGEYTQVSTLVAEVPATYRYQVIYAPAVQSEFGRFLSFSVSNGEGITDDVGITYGTLNDPRVRMRDSAAPGLDRPFKAYYAQKYDTTGTTPIVVASGIEAQLALAEAEFQTGGPWLTTLNALRTTCTSATACPSPAPAGRGGVAGLPPLTMPADRSGQMLLLFRERALWLFLTGHRQGDLRRLIRNYDVPDTMLYATGEYYLGNVIGQYGTDVNFPVPEAERISNRLYHGCFDRGA